MSWTKRAEEYNPNIQDPDYPMRDDPGYHKYQTDEGSVMRKKYGYIINDEGVRELVETEEENLHEHIQSFADETNIKNIVKRAAYDPSVWSKFGMDEVATDYTGNPYDYDLTGAPGSLAEAQNQIIAVKNQYNTLPKEVKNRFGNVENFIRTFGTDEWLSAMGLKVEQMPTKYPGKKAEAQEVKANESE